MKPEDEAEPPHRIVVVEDSDELRTFMVMALGAPGHAVEAARDAVEAFDIVRARRPDVVVTDVLLDGTNGLELISRIRSDLAPPLPTFLVCSGFPVFEQEALDRGAMAFLHKPFRAADLRTLVARALGADADAGTRVVVRDARDRSTRWRREAAAVADVTAREVARRFPEVAERVAWCTDWFARYVGRGASVAVRLRDGRLHVHASSDVARFPPNADVEESLPLARDVLETDSPALLHVGGPRGATSPAGPDGLFAAVPLRAPQGIAVGALCFVDDSDGAFDTGELDILKLVGAYATDIVADRLADRPHRPFLVARELLSRAAFEDVLAIELRQAEGAGAAMELAVFSFCPRAGWERCEPVREILHAPRSMAAHLADGQVALFVRRADEVEAERALGAAVRAVHDEVAVGGAGDVSLRARDLPALGATALVGVAEALAARPTACAGEWVERLLARRAPLRGA